MWVVSSYHIEKMKVAVNTTNSDETKYISYLGESYKIFRYAVDTQTEMV